jgi:stress-induced morphogen
VARHRLVYDCVADWMPHRIHALSLTATTAPIVTHEPSAQR